jgi:hypothetical protein
MVFIVVESWYPAKLARLVAQKYLEVTQKYPLESLGETVFGPILKATKDGVHVITAWECKDDKIKDSLMAIGKAMLMYAEIEGYHYSMETYIDAIEAFTMIDMKGPQ